MPLCCCEDCGTPDPEATCSIPATTITAVDYFDCCDGIDDPAEVTAVEVARVSAGGNTGACGASQVPTSLTVDLFGLTAGCLVYFAIDWADFDTSLSNCPEGSLGNNVIRTTTTGPLIGWRQTPVTSGFDFGSGPSHGHRVFAASTDVGGDASVTFEWPNAGSTSPDGSVQITAYEVCGGVVTDPMDGDYRPIAQDFIEYTDWQTGTPAGTPEQTSFTYDPSIFSACATLVLTANRFADTPHSTATSLDGTITPISEHVASPGTANIGQSANLLEAGQTVDSGMSFNGANPFGVDVTDAALMHMIRIGCPGISCVFGSCSTTWTNTTCEPVNYVLSIDPVNVDFTFPAIPNFATILLRDSDGTPFAEGAVNRDVSTKPVTQSRTLSFTSSIRTAAPGETITMSPNLVLRCFDLTDDPGNEFVVGEVVARITPQ